MVFSDLGAQWAGRSALRGNRDKYTAVQMVTQSRWRWATAFLMIRLNELLMENGGLCRYLATDNRGTVVVRQTPWPGCWRALFALNDIRANSAASESAPSSRPCKQARRDA